MKQRYFLFIFILFLVIPGKIVNAQVNKYWSNGGEIIFSWADYKDSSGKAYKGPPRFSLFFHANYKYNIDFGKFFGIAYGIGIRNIGFITRNENNLSKIKRRSYTLGVPVMIKLGNMKANRFLAIGAEYEWLFHYKEKHFQGRDKINKITGWRSDRTNEFVPSVFVGYQFSKAYMIKFQYYLSDFMNQDYVERDASGNTTRPYAGYTSRVFFISLQRNANTAEAIRKAKERRQGLPPAEARAGKKLTAAY